MQMPNARRKPRKSWQIVGEAVMNVPLRGSRDDVFWATGLPGKVYLGNSGQGNCVLFFVPTVFRGTGHLVHDLEINRIAAKNIPALHHPFLLLLETTQQGPKILANLRSTDEKSNTRTNAYGYLCKHIYKAASEMCTWIKYMDLFSFSLKCEPNTVTCWFTVVQRFRPRLDLAHGWVLGKL